MLGLADLDHGFLGQGRGRAGLHAGAAGDAFGGEEILILARRHVAREAADIILLKRDLIGWSMTDRHDAGLVTGALEAAVAARGQGKLPGTIFHTDRGAEYTSAACANACERLGLRQSMGRTGSCLDNAAAESLFATLKVELVSRRRYRTRAEARASIFAWIAWYNRRRLHSTIGYLPPVEWEQRHATLNPSSSTTAA